MNNHQLDCQRYWCTNQGRIMNWIRETDNYWQKKYIRPLIEGKAMLVNKPNEAIISEMGIYVMNRIHWQVLQYKIQYIKFNLYRIILATSLCICYKMSHEIGRSIYNSHLDHEEFFFHYLILIGVARIIISCFFFILARHVTHVQMVCYAGRTPTRGAIDSNKRKCPISNCAGFRTILIDPETRTPIERSLASRL